MSPLRAQVRPAQDTVHVCGPHDNTNVTHATNSEDPQFDMPVLRNMYPYVFIFLSFSLYIFCWQIRLFSQYFKMCVLFVDLNRTLSILFFSLECKLYKILLIRTLSERYIWFIKSLHCELEIEDQLFPFLTPSKDSVNKPDTIALHVHHLKKRLRIITAWLLHYSH